MELVTKQGFKKTEVGTLPSDWRVNPLEYYFKYISYGFTNPMPTSNSGIYMITAKDVNYGKILYNSARLTPEWAYNKYLTTKSKPIKGDILLTKDGTLGRLALVDDKKICINQSVAVIRPNEKVDSLFLKKLLESNYYQRVMIENAGGSTIKHIYITIVNKMHIGVPPTLKEQKAIATALSDVDDLITSLETLIAKKQAIKQGAMQQLLTPPHKGGKRLPGFSGEWVEKVIGKIGITYGGLSGKSKKDFEDGKYPYITFLNVMNNVVIDTSIFEYVHIKPGEQQNKARKGDLFFNTSSETPEEVGMCAVLNEDIGELYLNSFCFGFRLKEDSNVYAYFFSYLINSSIGRNLFLSLAQGATRYNLSKSNFNKLIIEVPSKKEQKAIAEILSDMDAEIEELETKKAKYQQLKQGMMQELLTGKTRLVCV
ncbi:restriction endonuclease subunit S [Tenacibaculum geojense]|uniref:Restriction endonuclease subunit S n=1 Tax=Tenacibaculum geojense TaxID=915352 RepID=A0ABW3JS10_9FLAO